MAIARARLRQELKDFIEVVLVPAVAAVLPWPLAYRVFRWVASWPRLYLEPALRALEQARGRGWASEPRAWLLTRKLTTIIDHADHYLARTRSDAWLRAHVDVQGEWPHPDKPALLMTFHWGAGMWGLRHARAAGLKCHALVAPVDPAHFAGRSVLYRYIVARNQSVLQALGQPFIDVATDLRNALRALRQGHQLIAVIDVPADQVVASRPVEFAGLASRAPTALFRLAVDKGLPVCTYVTGIREADGRRFLRIRQLGVHDSVDRLVSQVFSELDDLIRSSPPAWHFWSEADRFFVRHGLQEPRRVEEPSAGRSTHA